ncbi:MAG: methyltransferase [Erythrobacter sp.]|nr:methyltransferase [Erythrobacter sp.]|tara:strand:- start:842 stop:1462 length:621 start_codon:yes stop_codon:yes gene_type:complete
MVDPDLIFPATAMPDRDWWQELWPEPEETLRKIGIKDHMTVVDLCSGDGYFTAPLAKIVKGNLFAVDLDPNMLDQTREALNQQGATVRDLILADARDVANIIPEKADYVLIANTFHGIPDKTSIVEAVAKVLKPGGKLGIVNWYPATREDTQVLGKPRGPKTELRMSPETVQRIVERAGFRLASLVELPPFHYGIVFEKAGQSNHR